jgi:hypothetical protein
MYWSLSNKIHFLDETNELHSWSTSSTSQKRCDPTQQQQTQDDPITPDQSASDLNTISYIEQAPVYQNYPEPSSPAAPSASPAPPAPPRPVPTLVEQAPIYQTYHEGSSPAPSTASPIKNTPVPTFEDILGFDLSEQTRSAFEDIPKFILTLAENKDTIPLVNGLIKSNPCVSDVEGLLSLIKLYGQNIEKSAENLEHLVVMSYSLRSDRNITALTLFASEALVELDTIREKLDISGLFLKCGGSGRGGINAMREIAQVLYKLATRDDIPLLSFSKNKKESFLRYSQIVEVLTNVLDRYRKNLAKIDCFTSEDFLGDTVHLVSETLYSIAEALGALGYLPLAKEVRQYAAFTASTVDSLGSLSQFKIPGDCSSGSFSKAAKELKNVADLFAEVGLAALATELGVVVRLDLLP